MHRGNSVHVRTDFFLVSLQIMSILSASFPTSSPEPCRLPQREPSVWTFLFVPLPALLNTIIKKEKKTDNSGKRLANNQTSKEKKRSGWIIQCTPDSFWWKCFLIVTSASIYFLTKCSDRISNHNVSSNWGLKINERRKKITDILYNKSFDNL